MPELSVAVDLPAFTLSAMETIAPDIPLPVVMSVTRPLRENVVVGDGDVVVLLLPPHATAASISKRAPPNWNFSIASTHWAA